MCEEYGAILQAFSDLSKAKSRLAEYALKCSVDGLSNTSGSMAARKHMKVLLQCFRGLIRPWNHGL